MKKRLSAVLLCCMLALCAAACAHKKNEPEPSSAVAPSVSEPSSAGAQTPGRTQAPSEGSPASPAGETPSASASQSAAATPSGATGQVVIRDPEDDGPTAPILVPDPGEPTVTFSAASGFYEKAFSLTLSSDDGYTIYYTTDGSDPKKNGKKYEGPISIEKSAGSAGPLTKSIAASFQYAPPASQICGTVVKAYAKKGGSVTDTVTNTYIVSSGFSRRYGLPSVSISLAPNDFATKSGIYVSVMDHPFDTKERKIAFCEMFDRTGTKVSGQYVELSMNGNGSLAYLQKSMRIYFKKDAAPGISNNPGKLNYDIFEGRVQDANGDTIDSYKRLVLRNSGNDNTSSMLRDALMHRLSKDLNFDIMESQPAMVFINGEFWGLYNIRERYDTKYFMAHYGIAEENIVMLEAPSPHVTGNGSSAYVLNDGEPGDEKPFQALVNYAKTHDLSVKSYYEHVASQLDVENLIDYYIANLYFCNLDWPTNNIKVWRNKNESDPSGFDTKWRFVLVDLDMGCGLAGQATEDMMSRINCGTVLSDLMNAMMANEGFRSAFIDRFLYILENIYTADKMIPVLEAMAEEIEVAERLNIQRWQASGLTAAEWTRQIGVIRSFLENRSAYAKEDLYQYFNIVPSDVSVSYSEGVSSLRINSAEIAAGSTVQYDAGARLNIKVSVKDGYTFAGIAVTTADGKQTVFKSKEADITLSSKTTITVLTRKNGFYTEEALVAGSRDVFYLKANGDLYAWGASEYGQCGIFTGSAPLPVSVIMTSVKKVATAQGGNVGDAPHTLLLTADNMLYAVGNNTNLQTSCSGSDFYTIKPVKNVPAGTIADISAGYDHTLILMENGDLYGIGNNAYGQLGSEGLGGTVGSFTKIASGVSSMAAGRRHSLYVVNGKLYGIGDNRWNKLISSSTEKFTAPVLISSGIVRVFAGEHSSFCIDERGDLYYFGWRSTETFAAGASDGKLHKVLPGVRSVSMQDEHAIILSTDGKAYGWGMNSYNQITSGSASSHPSPVQISGAARAGAAGSWFSAILNSDGSVTVWGKNTSGISGTGETSEKIGETTIPASKFNII